IRFVRMFGFPRQICIWDQRSGCHHGISDGEDWKNHGLEFCRMLENGASRQQIADVIGVNVKTLYKYLPAS
ncbi:helix-turn-helix domain-containing protein, partial [Klebsiella pneumoniae]|uniref:helix-turn-helix domain-containing protein n=1 Tax=Klebsiella pneumoniae TaxID=573 RepID=UPI001FFBB78B